MNTKKYLLENGTPSLQACLKKSWFPNISYDYKLTHTYASMQSQRITNEIEFLIGNYEEDLDFERGEGND